jgi:pimeloyl-ACP methyl ester carboxylesterase
MKIQVNGIHLNVRETGSGEPALLFLHYWGGSSRTWNGVAARLAGKARGIATDHRGWGESDAPLSGYGIRDLAADAEGVIAALGLRSYVLVGHSMGGKAAQLIASRRPPGLKGLVLVAPSPAGPTKVPAEQLENMLHAYDSPESAAYTRDNILTHRPLSEALKAQVVEDSLCGSRGARLEWPTVALPEDYSAEAARIEVPTLVIAGAQDKVDPVERLRKELLPLVPHARMQVLEGVGHLSPLEAPEEVAAAIAGFLDQIAAKA